MITFHSLEDRLVKNKFRRWSTACTCPPEFPVCVCGGKAKAKLITRKPIEADKQELEESIIRRNYGTVAEQPSQETTSAAGGMSQGMQASPDSRKTAFRP